MIVDRKGFIGIVMEKKEGGKREVKGYESRWVGGGAGRGGEES